jgi:outer membrane lipoprotein-sorting protein
MAKDHRQSDVVEEAFAGLRRSQLPTGPSPQVLKQTLQAVTQAQSQPDRVSIMERIRHMNRFTKFSAAAGMLAVVLVGVGILLMHSPTVAFAQIRDLIEKAQTMSMTITDESEVKNAATKIDYTVTSRAKVYYKFPSLMRQEMTMSIGLEAAASVASTGSAAPAPQVIISIIDLANGKGLTLTPSLKMARVTDFRNAPPEAFSRDRTLIEDLKKALAGEHQDLGEKTLDGRKVKGYRCKFQAAVMDIWADAASGKPLRIEQKIASNDSVSKMMMTDIVMNPPLDDSLFDTTVPEGYTVEKQTLDLNIFLTPDIAKGLEGLARLNGGKFPRDLHLSDPLTSELREQAKKAKMSQNEAMGMASGLMQMKTLSEQGEFVYAGDGVKLGDKATPILWYKAKGAKKYRVVYGDLRAEETDEAPKPLAASGVLNRN